MKEHSEILALKHVYDLCSVHASALTDALKDIREKNLTLDKYQHLAKPDHRLLDQFAYRYTRLQDDMGAKLLPDILAALGEDVSSMSALDRFNRLEQIGWLPSADEWNTLRKTRNEFTHDYPQIPAERFERLQLALAAAARILEILAIIQSKIRVRFDVMFQ